MEDELLDEAPVTWFRSYRGAPLLLLPIRLMELIMDFPQEIPARSSRPVTSRSPGAPQVRRLSLTLEGPTLGAAGRDEIERDMGRTADVLMREATALAFVASTHPLAEEIRSPDDQDEQDDGNHGNNGVGAAAGAVGGRHGV